MYIDGTAVGPTQTLQYSNTGLLTAPAGIYVGYNEVMRMSGNDTISKLATTVTEAAARDPGSQVVVDLRNNGGGDNTTFRPFREALATIAEAHPESVRLITGRATFSAAT